MTTLIRRLVSIMKRNNGLAGWNNRHTYQYTPRLLPTVLLARCCWGSVTRCAGHGPHALSTKYLQFLSLLTLLMRSSGYIRSFIVDGYDHFTSKYECTWNLLKQARGLISWVHDSNSLSQGLLLTIAAPSQLCYPRRSANRVSWVSCSTVLCFSPSSTVMAQMSQSPFSVPCTRW